MSKIIPEFLVNDMANWRRSLHENPGVMYQEIFAENLIKTKLSEWGIPFVSNLGKTGIVATIAGKESSSGMTIGLRADMDALPIEEKSQQPWSSKISGVMHACGHDGHTASLLGTAKYLNETKNFNGTVRLIFQPAEEGGRGAHAMINDGLFSQGLECDFVYAVHNWPILPVGKAATRPGPIMASVDEFTVTVNGVGGHAAYPHLCVDPIVIFSQIAQMLQTLVSRYKTPQDPAVLSITNVKSGTGAFNVIPDQLVFTGTVRAYSSKVQDLFEKGINDICVNIAQAYGATVDVDYVRCIDATINHPAEAEFCSNILKHVLGEENVDPACVPSMGGEDFGAMLQKLPGAYVYIGQGVGQKDSPHDRALHSPFYDFNDAISPIIVKYFSEIVEKKMPL